MGLYFISLSYCCITLENWYKLKRNYGGWKVDEAWFILTDLGSLPAAINAYKQRMGIEEMFRDCKTVGYDLEGIGLK